MIHDTYGHSRLRSLTAGQGLQVHHLIEQRLASALGVESSEMLAIVVTRAEHQVFTNAWRAAIPYANSSAAVTTANATRQAVIQAATKIYAAYPELLKLILASI